MSPVLFISLPFVLLLLMSQGAGANQTPKKKKSKSSDYQDGDIIIIRKPAARKK